MLMMITMIVIVRIICFFNEWWVRFDYFGFRLKYFGPKHFQPQICWRHGGREGVKVVTKEFSLDLLKQSLMIQSVSTACKFRWGKNMKDLVKSSQIYLILYILSFVFRHNWAKVRKFTNVHILSLDTFWPSAIKGIGLQSDFLSWFLHFVALQYLFTSWRRITAQLYSHKEKQSSTMYDRCNRYNVQCKLYNHR